MAEGEARRPSRVPEDRRTSKAPGMDDRRASRAPQGDDRRMSRAPGADDRRMSRAPGADDRRMSRMPSKSILLSSNGIISRPRTNIPKSFFRPSLVDLCVPVMASNFINFPSFGKLPVDLRLRVVEILPLDLPLELAAHLVYEDGYWKRRSQLYWSNSDITAHGRSWKQLFFERHVADTLEKFDPTCNELSTITDLLAYCYPYIHNLSIFQLPSRMSLSILFDYVSRDLESLKLEYGCRNTGLKFDKYSFGMKMSDCRSLSAALSATSALTELNLSYNLLNCTKAKIIVEGILANPTIVHLDLSHNDISENGVSEVVRLLNHQGTILTVLNLCNNLISTPGALQIAEVLKSNEVLLSLNLRHNNIRDDGGQAIFEALYLNSALERLSLGSCDLSELSVAALCRLLHNAKSGLIGLDISSNNRIGESGGAAILSALEAGKVMREMNTEYCGMAEDVQASISKLLATKCTPDPQQFAYD